MQTNSEILNIFRYRERLNLKFLKSHSQAAIFDGVNWTFVPKGTDDFRTGVPGNTKSGLIRLPASTVPLIGSTASGTKKMQTSFGYRSDSGDATLFRKSVIYLGHFFLDVAMRKGQGSCFV